MSDDFRNHLWYPGCQAWWAADANRDKYFPGFGDYVTVCITEHLSSGNAPKPVGASPSSSSVRAEHA